MRASAPVEIIEKTAGQARNESFVGALLPVQTATSNVKASQRDCLGRQRIERSAETPVRSEVYVGYAEVGHIAVIGKVEGQRHEVDCLLQDLREVPAANDRPIEAEMGQDGHEGRRKAREWGSNNADIASQREGA